MKIYFTRRVVLGVMIILITSNIFSQTFTEQTGIVLPGVSSGSTTWGDYNNDAYADVLVVGFDVSGNYTVKVFKNNGSNIFSDQTGIFSPALPTLTGDNKIGAEWVDFDNDGFLDIIVSTSLPYASGGQNSLLIYRNGGSNTFTLQTTINYITWQGHSFDCGDYDNDGDLDILLVTNNLSRVFQNEGNFVFSEQTSIVLDGFYDSSCQWVDYDKDGDLDIFITGTGGFGSSSARIYRNNGDNTFTLQTNLIYSGYNSIDWSDYNNDGLPDILLTGSDWVRVTIYKNNGNNTFSAQPISLPSISDGVAKWGDFDNDGDLDIILSGSASGVYITKIFLNNGNNTFTELTGTGLDVFYRCSIDLFDFDNDNDLDILISGSQASGKATKVYKNNSGVSNSVPAAPSGLTSSVSGNDAILKWNRVTGDNTPAKAMTYNLMIGTAAGGINQLSPNSSTATGWHKIAGFGNVQLDTSWVIRNVKKGTYYWKVQAIDNSFKGGLFATGTFSFTTNYSKQASGLTVPARDGITATLSWSRGNGTNCIVFMKEGNTGSALPVNNTTYTPSPVFKSGTQIGLTGWYCVAKGAAAVVNITGLKVKTDYIFQVMEFDGGAGAETYNNQTLTGNPLTFKTSTFTEVKTANLAAVSTLSYETSSSNFWVDFDNDGDIDLLLVGTLGIKLYRNDGAGIFTLMPVFFSSGVNAACGDYNADGLVDIAICTNPTTIYKNTGGMTFTALPGTAVPGSSSGGSLDWGDYDNDGDLDLVMTGYSADGRISKVFKNVGSDTFIEDQSIILTGLWYGYSKWIDYNNDGFLDMIISGYTNDAKVVAVVYKNNGSGGFVEQTGITITGVFKGYLDWGDYDNDGFPDLIVTGQAFFTPSTKIYRNSRNGTFTEQTSIVLPQLIASTAKWGDYDNDGDLDIVITGYNGFYMSPITKTYKNNGNGTFTEDLFAILPGAGISCASWGDYDGDGDLDLLITGNTPDAAISKIFRNDIGVVSNAKPVAPSGSTATVNKSDVTFKWNAVRTDSTSYKAMTYNLRVGTSSGGINIVSPQASSAGFRRVVTTGNEGMDTTAILKKLPFGTYYWSVQAIDNGFAGGTPTSEGTFSVVPVQAQNLSAKITDNNSLLIKWERGNGDRCAVFCKQTSTGTAAPVNNTSYTADSQYGYGSQIGSSGWYCVYDGRSDSVFVSGLIYNKLYSFHIFEYMGSAGTQQYFTQVADGNPGVFSTSLFTEQTGITLNNAYNSKVVWGDYDKDGFVDLVIPGFPTRLYRNNGNNTFTEKTAIALTNAGNGSAEWGDYDNDGDLDLVITGSSVNTYPASSPVTKIYRNDGGDVFTEQTSIVLPQLHFSSVSWGDFNNDGYLDLLLTGATGADPNYNPVSKVFQNNGNNTFTEKTSISLTGVLMGSGRWVDYDNDGDLDIMITGAIDAQVYYNRVTKLYRNNGNGTFTHQTQIDFAPFSFSDCAWGDFNNDGYLDVIITTMGSMILYENTRYNSFTNVFQVPLSYQGACYAAWGDYDNDGYLDIILSNPGLDTKIFHNTHGIKVSVNDATNWFHQQDDDALKNIGYSFVNWIDYDNDGDLDFLIAKDNLPTKIFRNNTIMKSGLFKTDNTPASPTGTKAINTPSGVVLKWNPVRGDETTYKTMTYNIGIGTTTTRFNTTPLQSASNGFRRIAAMGNAQLDTAQIFSNLTTGRYYWKVQAVDQSLRGGALSALDSFDVKNTQAFFTFDTVCHGFPTHFTDQSVATDGIASRKWDFTDGSTSTLQNPVHQFVTGGTYNVKLVVTSTTGTKDSLIKSVIVKPRPLTGFLAPATCEGLYMAITNTTNNNGLTISSWYWKFGDGTYSTDQQPPVHQYLGLGSYNVLLKALATNGCIDSTLKTAIVSSYPVAAITTTATGLSFCKGDSVALSVGSNSNYSYQWKIGGTGITGASSSSYVAKTSGDYSVDVINLVGNCKTAAPAVTVTVKDSPFKPDIKSLNYIQGQCPGENPIRLFVDQPVSIYSYRWFRNGIALDNATSSAYEGYLDQGTYKVEASLSGCKTESDPLSLTFGNDAPAKPLLYVQNGPAVWYFVCSDTSASQYKWYFNGNLIPGATRYIYVAGKNFGTYYVIISNKSGCFARSDEITIPKGTTGIDDVDPFEDLNIYPNPSSGLITIDMNNQIFDDLYISVIAQNGKVIMKTKLEKTTTRFSGQLDLSGQARGIYFISLSLDKYKLNRKIIIK